MYFPYVRGRQYDLIALREALSKQLISNVICPVIEPVRTSSTLQSTVRSYSEESRHIILIRNPQVGNYLEEYSRLSSEEQELFDELYTLEYVISGYMIQNQQDLKRVDSTQDYALFLMNPSVSLEGYEPEYVFIPDQTSYRRRYSTYNTVLWESRFVPEVRNANYLLESGEGRDVFYSADHLHYRDEDYQGFSDYSVVTDDYSETGFAPYAVAFHLVYLAEGDDLFVKSFVSTTNDRIDDPAGKYLEALQMYINWLETDPIPSTSAMREFSRHHQEGLYPGLGTVKKLAFLHHFELISRYLEGRE